MDRVLNRVAGNVAPFVGAWIEIERCRYQFPQILVAPFVGAWIEIVVADFGRCLNTSLRSSERGLKSYIILIEDIWGASRSVRRSVD